MIIKKQTMNFRLIIMHSPSKWFEERKKKGGRINYEKEMELLRTKKTGFFSLILFDVYIYVELFAICN